MIIIHLPDLTECNFATHVFISSKTMARLRTNSTRLNLSFIPMSLHAATYNTWRGLVTTGCQQTFRSSDNRLSLDQKSCDNRLSLDLKVC